MDYPFDINYDTDHPELTFWTPFPADTTAVYNATDKTLDVSTGNNRQGLLALRNTPPVPVLTFGAEIKFTENIPTSATTNYFGMWGLVNPEVNYVGYRVIHRNDASPAPSGSGWSISVADAGFSSVDEGTKVMDGVNGIPAFAAGVWYDIRYEYVSNPLNSTNGAAWMRLYVNDVFVNQRIIADYRGLPITPAFFGYNAKYKVRRIYGRKTASFEYPVFFKTDVPKESIQKPTDPVQEVFADEEKTYLNYVYNENLTIRGRVLDDSFKPSQELVYAYETDTMRPVHRVASDSDGFYVLDKLDSSYNYTVMVKRDGKMRTPPFADYIGFGELAGAYRIRGENIGEVEVKVFSEQTGEYLGQVKTNVNGQFTIPNVNPNHLFALVFREPTGAWEDRVSSRRIPELTEFTLTFNSTLHDDGDRINGALTVRNGHAPFTATADLKPGVSLVVQDRAITFAGETVMQGPYSIPITVQSPDGGIGVFVAEGVAGYPRAAFHHGTSMSSILEAQIDRDDPYFFTNTKTLLNFDGGIADSSNNELTWWQGTTTSIDAANKKFGAGSLKFTGGGCIATYGRVGKGIQLGTGDFTLEGWIWIDPSGVSATREIFTAWTSGSSYATFYYQGSSKALQAWKSSPGLLSSNATIVPPSQWVHVAFSRSGGILRAFQNGTQVFSVASTHDFTEDYFCLGGQTTTSTTEAFIGNMDDIRVTVGVGRYTANFTPPVKAYPSNK